MEGGGAHAAADHGRTVTWRRETPMSSETVIVIGAGHNGLTAAAYLARAGRNVRVLEQTDRVGGLAAFDEIGAANNRVPTVFPETDRLHPSIVADLRLERYGLRIRKGGGTLLPRPGGDSLYVPPDGIPDGVDEEDGRALRELERFIGEIGRALDSALSDDLPDPDPRGARDLLELLALGWRLRRLGREGMLEAMRLLPMSLRDILEERIEDERLRAALAWAGLKGGATGPWAPGGGFSLAFRRPAWCPHLFPAPCLTTGPSLAETLADATTAAGGEIRTGVRVERIRVREGTVVGIVTAEGEEVDGTTVLSGTDPRTTLLNLLEPGWLETDVLEAAGNIRGAGSVSVARIVLTEPLASRDPARGTRPIGRVQIGSTLQRLEEASDQAKYGGLPERPVLELTCADADDGGKQAVHAWVQYTPRELREGSWDEERDTLGELVVATVDECLPGFASSVESVDVITPADIEARFGIRGGHPYHVELALDQVLYMRPMPGCYDGRTPVTGLYLAGPGIHPGGGGITGLPGKLVAERVLEDARAS